MVNIKLLGLILDEGMHKKANSLLNRLGIKFKTVSSASGTASPSVLDYFGLAETRKELFLAIIPENLKYKVLEKINNVFHLEKEGTGIGFILPISSSNKFLMDSFKKADVEEKVKDMKEDNEYLCGVLSEQVMGMSANRYFIFNFIDEERLGPHKTYKYITLSEEEYIEFLNSLPSSKEKTNGEDLSNSCESSER